MQDKEHLTYNEDYISKNWSQVAKRLDEVVPVAQPQRNNNKFLLLFLSGLLVLSTGVASYFAFMYASHIPPAALIKEKIIYKDRVSLAPVQKRNQLNKDVSTASALASAQLINSSNAGTYYFDEVELYSDLNRLTENEVNESDTQNNTKPLDYIGRISTQKVDMNNTSRTVHIVNNESTNDDFIEDRNLDFHIAMQAIVTTDKDFTGVGFATGVDIPVGKRFGISTGLGVNVISREHYFVSPIDRGSSASKLPNAGLASPIPAGTDTYYNGLNSIKQVYLPVSLNYNLTNKIVLNSGVRVRYTYSEDLDENLPGPVTRRVPITLAESESIFADTNLGISAGVTLRLNPHFSILLDGEWGVNRLISDPLIPNFGEQPSLNLLNLTTSYKF